MPDSTPPERPAPAPEHPLDQLWYVRSPGGNLGPYPGSAFARFVAEGSVMPGTEVAASGGSEWRRAIEIPAFAALFGAGAAGPPLGAPRPAGWVPAIGGGPRFAGFWMRTLAYLIDSVIVGIGSAVAGAILGILVARDVGSAESLGNLVGFVGAILYFVLPVGGAWQATPGKRLCGLRVMREDGGPVGYGQAFGRYLSYILSGLILGIGFFMVGWTDQKRGLHDMICSTRVIYGRA